MALGAILFCAEFFISDINLCMLIAQYDVINASNN